MLAVAALVAAVAAAFSGLLWFGDVPRLPPYEELKKEHELMAQGGYDLGDLAAPRVAGTPLRILAVLMRAPIIGRLMCRLFYNDNKMLLVRRLASYVPDQPLYYPYVDPTKTVPPPEKPLVLADFSKKNANSKSSGSAAGFKHWSISDYTTRYAAGELTPVQVARAVIAAIEDSDKGDKPLRAIVEKHDDLILEQARASAARYAQGKPLGVLDGVPVVIKDEMDVKGHKLNVGTSFLGDAFGVADEDSVPVARLRAQGAIIVGTTNMHEIGGGVSGFNMTFGVARNPYNVNHHTGGSSSGSAVAVASGIVPLAVGVDGGGSIRIPAALCGVVGIKPTFMRVPPFTPDCPSVAHTGPIAGSVRDAAVGYAVLSGGDQCFPRSFSQPPVDLRSFEETKTLRGLKVGFFSTYNNHSSPEIALAVKTALHKLEELGAELVEVELDYIQAIHLAHSMTISAEMAQNLDKFYSEFHRMSPEIQNVLNMARNYSAMDFVAMQRVRAFALRQYQEKVFSKVDVFVCPSTAMTAPEIPGDIFPYGELNTINLGRIMRYSVYSNFVGNPGVAVPIGYDSAGLPLSLQVQSSHFEEDVMLRFAHVAEQLYAATQKPPQVYYSIIDDAAKQPKD